MSLKRNRTHYSGYTNLDFRTKNDKTSLNLFQPWKIPKDFGTMGHENNKIQSSKTKSLLKISKNINNLQNLNSSMPDPKTFSSCIFYKKNKIEPHIRKLIFNDRIAQLDESIIGKEKFNGDSMMIADTIKERKLIKLKKSNESLKIKKNLNKKGWISAKNILNNNDIKDKLNNNNNNIKNLDEIIDMNKIKTIRNKLIERYKIRKNLNTMFRLWDINNTGEINLFDAYEMINKIGFNINYNETRVLIALVNKRKNGMLNLSEFLSLIVDKEIDYDSIDLKKMEFKNEEFFESIKKENIKQMQNKYFNENRMKNNKIDDEILIKTDEISFLEEFFRLKIPKFAKKIREISGNEKMVDFNGFKKIIYDFNLPKKFNEENILKNFFNKYLIINKDDNNNNIENFNFEKFAQNCIKNSINVSEKNDFFFVKDKNLDYLQKKIVNSKSEINLSKKKLESFEQKKKSILNEYLNQIEENKKKQKEQNQFENEINSMQPSTEFINKIFNNKEEYSKKLNEIEKSFLPLLTNKIRPKTRRGANPILKNTFLDHQPEKNSPMFINEKERFKCKSLNDKIEFAKLEKENKNKIKEYWQNIRKKHNDDIQQHINDLELKEKQNKNISMMNKIQRIYEYEFKNKLRNELIE